MCRRQLLKSLKFLALKQKLSELASGLPDFFGATYQNRGQIYQSTVKDSKWQQNISNCRKIAQTAIK
jgi:hypothetical protein